MLLVWRLVTREKRPSRFDFCMYADLCLEKIEAKSCRSRQLRR
ncbi:MAG: hypothetical protein QXJ32_03080 [Thermoplasmata archaeon]